MNKFKFQIIVNGVNISENRNILHSLTDTLSSVEKQSSLWKSDFLFVLILPDRDKFRMIGKFYETMFPVNYKVIYCDNYTNEIRRSILNTNAEYVVTVNAGDTFSQNTFLNVYKYFEKAKGNIDAVGIRLSGECSKYTDYNNLFSKTEPVNVHLIKEYTKYPFDLNGIFIKANVAREKAKMQNNSFNENCFLIDVLNRRKTFGMLGKPYTLVIGDSEQHIIGIDEFEAAVDNSISLLSSIAENNGFVPFFVQHATVRQFIKMLNVSQDLMGEYIHPDYDFSNVWSKFSRMLKYIDEKIIMELTTTRYNKLFLLSMKYGSHCDLDIYYRDFGITFGNTFTYLFSSFPVRYELLKIENEVLVIEGIVLVPCCFDMKNFKIGAMINDSYLDIEQVERHSDRFFYERRYLYEKGFKLEIPLHDDIYNIKIACVVNNNICVISKYEFWGICSLGNEIEEEYYYKNGYAVRFSLNQIICEKCSEEYRQQLEEALRLKIIEDEPERADEIIEIRDHYWNNINKKPKQIWLISDRNDRADDNGEAFFRYIIDRNDENIDAYFVLSRGSENYRQLNETGNVIEPLSQEHKKLFVISDYVISSQMNESVYNPFNDDIKYFRDLFRQPKQIFLQHGVIHNSHGKAFGKYSRDFYGFIVSANDEKDYILNPKLHYTERRVWLTGLARWDRLYRDDKRRVTIMPTWRKYLTTRVFDDDEGTKIWQVNDNFVESEYFRFYNALINDSRLLDAADKYGYKICFMPHVNFLKQIDKFEHNDRALFYDYNTSYRQIFAESSMIVTDYSSAVFDFSYMYLPIIYCQFDKEDFYASHTVKKGYFDHERDGFGEVTRDIDETVNQIIEYMSNGCKIKDKYRQRISDFFGFSDRKCCERTFDMIKKLETAEEKQE